MPPLLIATRSKGKYPEIVAALKGIAFDLLSLNDLPDLPADYNVEEPANTFEGNAIIKAMTVGKKTGLLTLADDSGLEVDALGGRPGVFSARYTPGTDRDRYEKLLSEMLGIPDNLRTARFRTIIAIYDPATDKIRLTEGVFEGRILREPVGEHGFGFDPVFYSDEVGKTNAQLTVDEKNAIDHRGKALRMAKEILHTDFL